MASSSKRANQARTAAQKYLSEIVRDSPVWINTATARKLGIRVDDVVEITTYRPKGRTYRATSESSGKGVGFNINAILPIAACSCHWQAIVV
jgi:anaerobic selenocysteine-containing dehydrogenase